MPILSRTLCIAVAGATFVACSDEVGVEKLIGELSTEQSIDFGDVQRGIKIPVELDVKNVGSGAINIDNVEFADNFTTADYEFKISESAFALGPNQNKIVTVTFQPFADQQDPVSSWFKFNYDCAETCKNFTVTVTGRGVTSGLRIEPDPIDFGTVLIGSSRTLDVTITNTLSVGVDVTTRLDQNGVPEIVNMGGLGRFEILSPVAGNGSLLMNGALLDSGASVTVQIRYVPDPSQEGQQDRGRWTIANCDNALCELKVVLLGKGTNAAVECDPAQLEFGDVNPEATARLTTRCTNVATEVVTVTGWRMAPGTASEFTVEPYTGVPASLQPGADFAVEVVFAPTLNNVGRNLTGTLEISGRNPRANRDLQPTTIPVSGQAGGPDIEATPPEVNFGQIALGTTAQKRILLENVGYSELNITSVNGDVDGTNVFTAVLEGSGDVAPSGAATILVTFSPLAAGAIGSHVLIVSNDADERELMIEVNGIGVDLPPCAYTLTPASINFGIVQVLRPNTQGFRIENIGSAECLVNDIELSPTSQPGFGLAAGNETGLFIQPGDSKTVIVDFTPQRAGLHMGSIPFYISNPNDSNPVVELRGTGSESALLISPNEIDFGLIGVNCSTRNRTITLYNTGANTTRIQRIEIPAGVSTEFQLDNLPAGIPAPPGAGAPIAPGQSVEFDVRYHANDLGQDTGFLHIFEQGNTEPYVVPLYGGGATTPINEDAFTQLETPEVDIMFVIDNSCSMSDEQASLTSNFQSFIQFADAQALNYQIAVVSTDMQGGQGGACSGNPSPQRPGGATQGACGYFADGDGANNMVNADWRLISPDEQPSPEVAFTAIATQGINGAGVEQGLEAAYRALSSPLITGWNAGFLRQDAYLALIFVSDEEDQSPQSVDFYVNYYRAIKGFRNSNLFSASAIVIPPEGCAGSNNIGNRQISIANRTGGIVESICTSDWSQSLQNLGLSVFGYKSRFFLSNQPVFGTVEVWVDGVKIDAEASSGQVRWSYEPTGNSVNFAPLAIPEPGSEIVIRYLAECL